MICFAEYHSIILPPFEKQPESAQKAIQNHPDFKNRLDRFFAECGKLGGVIIHPDVFEPFFEHCQGGIAIGFSSEDKQKQAEEILEELTEDIWGYFYGEAGLISIVDEDDPKSFLCFPIDGENIPLLLRPEGEDDFFEWERGEHEAFLEAERALNPLFYSDQSYDWRKEYGRLYH